MTAVFVSGVICGGRRRIRSVAGVRGRGRPPLLLEAKMGGGYVIIVNRSGFEWTNAKLTIDGEDVFLKCDTNLPADDCWTFRKYSEPRVIEVRCDQGRGVLDDYWKNSMFMSNAE